MLNAAHRLPAEDSISYPRDEGPLDAYSRAVATVVDRVGPAVVRVESIAEGSRRAGVGSGVIIAGDGLVLTNSHVVGGAKRVRLSIAEGGEAEAQVLGDDPDTDLALLRSELPSIRLQQRSATQRPCGGGSSSSRSATRSASNPRSQPVSSRRSGDLYVA